MGDKLLKIIIIVCIFIGLLLWSGIGESIHQYYKHFDQNKISSNRIKKECINDLEIGESSWISPFRIIVDENRYCWVYLYANINNYNLLHTVKVTKIKEGFVVDITKCDHQWAPYPILSNYEKAVKVIDK